MKSSRGFLLTEKTLKFIRFILVGVLNTAFSYGVYAFLIFLHFHYALASFLQLAASILFNFQTIGRLVFGNRDNKRIFSFVAVYLFIYLVYVAGLKGLNYLNIGSYAAGALLILPVAVLSYFLNEIFVFGGAERAKAKASRGKTKGKGIFPAAVSGRKENKNNGKNK